MNIDLIDVTKTFNASKGKVEIFKNLNLTISSGDFTAILGPNGCGKTTLFNLIIGLDTEYSGQINIDHSPNRRTEISYMMQKDLLLPWRTVYENIIIGLEIKYQINNYTKDLVLQYLNMFGIVHLKDNYPAKLSGGERQKVALIRTLILESDVLLLDEPFSSIDYNTRLELQAKIYSVVKESKKTALLITHDIDEAIAVSDRIIILNNNPHGILKDFRIELNINNRSPLTARQHPHFASYYSEIWKSLPKQKSI